MTASLHVIAGLAVAHGGPSYSVPRLCRALVDAGDEVVLASVENGPTAGIYPAQTFAQDHAVVPGLSALRLSHGLAGYVAETAPRVDVVHGHGLWLAPNIVSGRSARRAGRRLVVSPRGMLSPAALSFSPWKKRLVWALAQRDAVAQAAWHATSEDEVEDLRGFGLTTAPVAVIPNGVDMPSATAVHDPAAKERTVVFLSRVHPKKGLADLVAAWALLEPRRPGWRLVIAGPDELDHTAALKRQAQALGAGRIVFPGALYGADRDALMAGADLFVLPTLGENFGIAVAEALAAGVPAIVSKGAPWPGLEANGCGWWTDHGVPALEAALADATALPPESRRAMGLAGREWMAREFSWAAIAMQMQAYYRWLLGAGERPAFVRSG